METALTCSQNSQLVLPFWVKNALELTAFLARNHVSNNTITPGSSSSPRTGAAKAQRHEAFGSSGVSLTRRSWAFVYCEEEQRHVRLHGRTRCLEGDAQPPLPSTGLCNRRVLITSDLFCPLALHHPSGPNTKAKNNTFQTTVCDIQGQSDG